MEKHSCLIGSFAVAFILGACIGYYFLYTHDPLSVVIPKRNVTTLPTPSTANERTNRPGTSTEGNKATILQNESTKRDGQAVSSTPEGAANLKPALDPSAEGAADATRKS